MIDVARVIAIRDSLVSVLIRDRGHRCAYCHLPTKRRFPTQNGAQLLVCSDACEAAIRARVEGYNEKQIQRAWNACSPEERRPTVPSQNVLTESGVHLIPRAKPAEERHDEGHDDVRSG